VLEDLKKKLRTRILQRRDSMDYGARASLSEKVIDNLFSTSEFIDAETVFFYVNFRSEVETLSGIRRALSEPRRVAVPYCVLEERRLEFVELQNVEEDLVEDAYGILEPLPSLRRSRSVPHTSADVVLFPGSVFDLRGGRMGYGAGYYDKTFAAVEPKPVFIALAFDFQVLADGESVPMAEHDLFVDKIVTEKRVVECPAGVL